MKTRMTEKCRCLADQAQLPTIHFYAVIVQCHSVVADSNVNICLMSTASATFHDKVINRFVIEELNYSR